MMPLLELDGGILVVPKLTFFCNPRRQGTLGGRGHKVDPERRGQRESQEIHAPNTNASVIMSLILVFIKYVSIIFIQILEK